MKILHLCLGCFYIDGYSYQENLLTKYHKQMGYDVYIIASLISFNDHGNQYLLCESPEYTNADSILVHRLSYKEPLFLSRLLRTYKGTYSAIAKVMPDIIFVHGMQFLDIRDIVKYVKKNRRVRVYVDNHSDFSNSATNWISKNIQHRIIWRHYARLIEPYASRFYGVLPARVDFLIDVYGLPKDRVELLVMGADDDRVIAANDPFSKEKTREAYGVDKSDILIITGGKIDQWKKQTLLLMDAVNSITDERVKLIVFGSIVPELKHEIEKRCTDRVRYIGWIDSNATYQYFAAADLVVFPGRHSVFWEQVAGQGKPMIVKHWDGTTHIDRGGNVAFLYKDSVSEIKDRIIDCSKRLQDMIRIAQRESTAFLYSNIAKQSIERD